MSSNPERWPRKKRRATKWRQHCSTCGVSFKGPQIWGYCSKLCEVSRDGTEDPGDLPSDVIEEMLQLGLAKEIAPWRDKQVYQDCVDSIERSHARKNFHPEKAIKRDDPRFWEYIMDKQFAKLERTRLRLNEEFLRTLNRLCQAEKTTGSEMHVLFPDVVIRTGLKPPVIRRIVSSVAIEKNLKLLPPTPSYWAELSLMSDDDIDAMLNNGSSGVMGGGS